MYGCDPPPSSGVLAARRRLHDRARLKLSRTGSRSTTSGDHPRGPRRAGDKLILFIHRPTPCTPRGQCQRGHFRRLLQTGIAGSGLLWASQLDPQPAWPGPGRGGHCGGRGGSRDMKTGVSERSRNSCSDHQPSQPGRSCALGGESAPERIVYATGMRGTARARSEIRVRILSEEEPQEHHES